MRRTALVSVLVAGCSPMQGEWNGECTYLGNRGNEKVLDLRLDLDAPDSEGLGVGTGKVIDAQGDVLRTDVLYVIEREVAIAVDLYLEDGDYVFLRGNRTEQGNLTGVCASLVPTQFSFDRVVDCVLDFDLSCNANKKWKPDGKEVAPVKESDLDGEFRLTPK